MEGRSGVARDGVARATGWRATGWRGGANRCFARTQHIKPGLCLAYAWPTGQPTKRRKKWSAREGVRFPLLTT